MNQPPSETASLTGKKILLGESPSTDLEDWQLKSVVGEPQTSATTEESELYLPEASTKSTLLQEVKKRIETLFQSYSHYDFEDGSENDFADLLRLYLDKDGSKAVYVMENVLAGNRYGPQLTSEALRWLGHITHSESHNARLLFLARSLRNLSRWVRDGAALGLGSMKDSRAIPTLKAAIGREKIIDLREDMEAILKSLAK